MKLIKNEVVSMDWDANLFIQSRSTGFVAAIHMYGDTPVIFQDGDVYTLVSLDDDDEAVPFTTNDIISGLRDCRKSNDIMEDYFCENYVDLSNEDNHQYYNLSEEDAEDIANRLEDLSGYWAIIEEEM